MSDSRAEAAGRPVAVRLVAAAVVLGLAGAAGPGGTGCAQESVPPIPLTTPSVPPIPLTTPSVPPIPLTSPSVQPISIVPPLGTGSAAMPPASLPPDAAGVLTPADGGLGPALWTGSPVGLVRRLLVELPVAAPSPSQRRLTLRLLLSAAVPPAGDDTGRVLAPVRVAKLAALGATTESERLLAAMPGGRADPVLAHSLAEAPAAGDPAGLAAVARSEAADADARVDAAERAAAAGALSGDELAAAYASVRFAPAALARPLTAGEPGARGRALVYQASVGESQPAVQAELVGHWFQLLEPAQVVGPVAALPLAVLARLPVDAATAWLAPAAVRAFWASGRAEAAIPWLKVPSNPSVAAAVLRLWPLAVLAGGEVKGASGGGFDAWLAAALAGADAGRRARVAGVLALLQAAGEPVKEAAWIETTDKAAGDQTAAAAAAGGPAPSAALWQTLNAATADHRVGEVVLVALTILGNGGPQALPPVVLAQVVTSLRAVGLSAEALGLAREAVAALLDW